MGSCADAEPEQHEWGCAVPQGGLSVDRLANISAPSVALSTAAIHVPCRMLYVTPVLATGQASPVFVIREGVVAAQCT